MIITTTPSVEGRTIREYKGVVFGEVISGVNIFRDFGAGLSNIFGGRSAGYEEVPVRPASAQMQWLAWTWTTRYWAATTVC